MNDEPGFSDFADCTVAIWGLGLIGGSLSYALTGKCASLIGIDPDPHTVDLARDSGIFTTVSQEPNGAMSDANLIILAAPVNGILEQINALPLLHPRPGVILDLGSTKRKILDAMSALPAQFDPVGGHPMCGNEKSSFQHADPSLFIGANFALVELPRTSSHTKILVETVVQQIGSNPLWLDAETHDRWTAMTSHMPYLIANALSASIPLDAGALAGSGLRSTSRLAAASPTMMLDILMTNRDFLLESLQQFQGNLEKLIDNLREQNPVELEKNLQQSRNARSKLLNKGNL